MKKGLFVNQQNNEFLVIGENVHTTRAITNKSPRLVEQNGIQGLGFKSVEGEELFLPISEEWVDSKYFLI